MASEKLVCPRCGTILNKPAQLFVLGEIQEGGGSFMAFGNPEGMLPCARCGAELSVKDIVAGKYDPKAPSSVVAGVGLLVILGIIVFLVMKCS